MNIFDYNFNKSLYRTEAPLTLPDIGTAVANVFDSIPANLVEPYSLDFGRVKILPDTITGIVMKDSLGAEVFKVLVGGTDVGDVIIGNITGPNIKVDNSANTVTLIGTAELNSLRINQTPVAETPVATHTVEINFNGTDYRLLCVI